MFCTCNYLQAQIQGIFGVGEYLNSVATMCVLPRSKYCCLLNDAGKLICDFTLSQQQSPQQRCHILFTQCQTLGKIINYLLCVPVSPQWRS